MYEHPKVRLSAHVSWARPRPSTASSSSFVGEPAALRGGRAARGRGRRRRGLLTVSAPGAVVVGTGFGCRVHVPALRAAGFDVLALVGTRPRADGPAGRAARASRGVHRLDEALALAGVDAVTIATPPRHARGARDRGGATRASTSLCEKPFALDARRGRSDARRGGGRRRRRTSSATSSGGRPTVPLAAAGDRRRAASANRGSATFVQYVPLVADPEMHGARRGGSTRRAGGGWLGASGSHVVDQVRAWLGEFESLSARPR